MALGPAGVTNSEDDRSTAEFVTCEVTYSADDGFSQYFVTPDVTYWQDNSSSPLFVTCEPARIRSPHSEVRLERSTTLPGLVTALAALQLLIGAVYALLALLLPGYCAVVVSRDSLFQDLPQPWLAGALLGVAGLLWMVPFILLHVVAGVGLLRRRAWGWVAALVSSFLLLCSCCAPIGLAAVVLLVRRDVRAACGLVADQGSTRSLRSSRRCGA